MDGRFGMPEGDDDKFADARKMLRKEPGYFGRLA